MACGFNFRNIGLLPASGETAAKFSEFCGRSFRAPEVERDLIGLEESKLAEANDYHLISGSFPSFDLTCCATFFRLCKLALSYSFQSILLSRSLRQQCLLYHKNIEEDNVMKTRRIEELEKEVASL